MEEIDVVYLYEKVLRELDVACAVKALAKRLYGLRIEIVQQNHGYSYALRNFRPRVVVLPFCYQNRSNNIYLTNWRKAIFFNLTWEQLFYPGNQTAKTPRGNFAIHHVIHHAWSDFYADFLKQQGVPEQHIWVNGNPAYALYDAEYRSYFKKREELASQYQLDVDKKWVFFPENYNWAFYDDGMLNQMIHDGQMPDDVYGMKEFSARSFEEVMRWCNVLADSENIELIIRPRPSTLLDDFIEKIKTIIHTIPKQMHINQHETVRDWILSCDTVVSSYSTSLIEAAIAGKSIYMLEPYPLPVSLRQDWHKLLPHLTNEQEFLSSTLGKSTKNTGKSLEQWARTTMISRGDPIRNLTDYLARLCQGKINRPLIPSRKSVTLPGRIPFPSWMLFEYRRLITRLRPPDAILPSQIHPEYKNDVVNLVEINQRVNQWTDLLSNDMHRQQPSQRQHIMMSNL